ncbi:MAG TPA: PAS domain S-box protein [Gammaproteobacteria bacterium]
MSTSKRDNGSSEPRPGRPAEADYRRLIGSVRDYAIFMLDPAGRVASWNAGAEALTGYAEMEILGAPFSCLYSPERIATGSPEHELGRAAEDGRFEEEGWHVRKDGTPYWANVVITALSEEVGRPPGFAVVARDWSTRQAESEALRESEERFRALVEGISDYAIFMLDTKGVITTWNPAAQRMKGYEASEIIGSHISKLYPPDAVKRGWPEFELRMATLEGRFEDEGWRVRKDGSRFWANVVITALRDSAGNLRGFAKVTRDLTEQRRQEEALLKSEERFRLLVDGVDDYAIVMLGRNGFVSSWNSGAQRIQGYTSEEILGKHFSRFYTSEDVTANKPWQELALAKENGRAASEGWRVRRDGSLFWASSVITALHDSNGQLYGFASVTQDLTQRRHAETLADTAERMHEFLAMLAHELRNPLAPIRNAVALMGKKGLSDPTLESMRQTIDRQSAHLTRIIDDLLDINRIARGRFAVEMEPIDLKDVLARAVEASQPLVDAQGHRLHLDVPAGPLPLDGDALRLTQAFLNILNNAAKYTAPGGDITLRAGVRGTDVEVRVRDTGRGIPREDLEKVFDLFTQIDPDTHRADGGLGVGLALVRRVVELHAGTVQARSEGSGRGSEFVVRLPLAIRQPRAVPIERPDAGVRPGSMRMLVADDNQDAADSLRMLLEAMGHRVLAVYDGPAVLASVDSFRPDVILLDIGMPHMSGYDLARELRARFGDAGPTLVAVTGWGQEADRQRALGAGFHHHFTKPVTEEALQRLLAGIWSGRNGAS